jgi:hypothetical protein
MSPDAELPDSRDDGVARFPAYLHARYVREAVVFVRSQLAAAGTNDQFKLFQDNTAGQQYGLF